MTKGDTPAEIARRLSAAMREGLVRKPCRFWWGDTPACMPHRVATATALFDRGLCRNRLGVVRGAFPLTPLGLLVRVELEKEANGHE